MILSKNGVQVHIEQKDLRLIIGGMADAYGIRTVLAVVAETALHNAMDADTRPHLALAYDDLHQRLARTCRDAVLLP